MMTKFGQKCKTFLDILHLVTTFFLYFFTLSIDEKTEEVLKYVIIKK